MTSFISFWAASPVLRALAIGALVLVLLVPLAMVGALVHDRRSLRDSVEAEVAGKWGGAQRLVGPILSVPYRRTVRRADGEPFEEVGHLRFLPETLEIDAELVPEIRYRGIYPVPLYRALLRWTGAFERPQLDDWSIAEEDVLWNDAVLVVAIPDLRGIQQAVVAQWNDRPLSFEPGPGAVGLGPSGIHARLPGVRESPPGARLSFAFELALNGSREFVFAPVGKESLARIQSSWPSPSFGGQFLPSSRQVAAEGFTAEWNVSYLTRPYPQRWKDSEVSPELLSMWMAGVELFQPVDSYSRTTRTVKYGVLFLFLTFAAFFLFEVLGGARIHPFQYLLVGFALSLFYLLLLSFSEHVDFALAYLLASAATVGLITAYSVNVLRAGGRAAALGAGLAALYGYLYLLLKLEDYALLFGAIGLFLALAGAMWLTRRVDWYTVGSEEPGV